MSPNFRIRESLAGELNEQKNNSESFKSRTNYRGK